MREKKSSQGRKPSRIKSLDRVKQGFELAAAARNSAIYDWDLRSRSIAWTDALTSIFGWKLEQIEPTDEWWMEKIHPADRESVLNQITTDLNNARNFCLEYRFQDAHGNYRSVIDTGLLMRSRGGKVIRVVGSLVDITERKKREQRLRESEQQYRMLFDSNPSPMWVLDRNNYAFLAVNEAAIEHYGYSRDEFLGMTALAIRLPEEHPRFIGMIQQQNEDSAAARDHTRWRHRKKDGSIIDVEIISQNLLFEGKPARMVLINDVTLRRQAHEALELLTEATTTANETDDLHEMISRVLETICKNRRWQIGQAWFVEDDRDALFCSHSFYAERDLVEFRQLSLKENVKRGSDLPGEIWQRGEPVLFGELDIKNSERAKCLLQSGLKSGFGFPIQGAGQKTFAIFEFYAETISPPDSVFLEALQKLASYLAIVFDRKREQERIRYQATHDLLTGLPNRLLFQDRFNQALAQASRKEQMLAIFMLDLDNFKTINDTLGHAIGDQLLHVLAQRLSKSMREVDTIARMGGDELIMLLPDLKQIEDAAKIGQRILSLFEQPFLVEGNELFVTTSVGISIYPYDGENAQRLLKNVDVALYRAKEKGRNNYQLYTPSMTAAALARLSMENSLKQALARNEFLLYYQPQFDLMSGKVVAVEALLRWQHPEMGICLPAEFLPLAEETGLIGPMWEWALRKACEQMKKWNNAGLPTTFLTMNIPPSQFQLPNLPQRIQGILSGSKLEPQQLELEITESMARKELFTLALVDEFKALGIRIGLDDFGTGYTSLGFLKEITVDTIKIDPYFVRGIQNDPVDDAIVRAIITLAHGMHARVVAEAVETRGQMEVLRGLGCDALQGFLVCKPAPEENITKLLLSGQLHL